MAVPTVHNVQTFEGDGSGDSYTVGTESNRVLVVIVSSEGSDEDVSSVSFGGTALTEATEAKEPSSGFLNTATVWYLPNPSGTANVTASFSSSAATIVCLYLSGADTSAPIDTTATGTSSLSPNSVSITPAIADAQVIGGFSQGNPDDFTLTGVDKILVDYKTQLNSSDNTTNTLVGRVAPGGSTATMNCELVSGSFNRSAGVLVAFAPSTSTATYTVSGTVTESDGTTGIDGASVTLDNVAGANSQTTTTDANGDYSLSVTVADSDLPDTWDVTADASGFTAQTKQVSADTSSTSYTTDFSLSASGITGTASITDGSEIISATGQTEVSGTLSVTDGNETLTINGATKVSGTVSITDAAEQISGEGSVITTGSLAVTDSGELISMVSTLQDITGTVSITDSGEDVSATGEVKIAGTATLNDGSEEVVIIGQNDVTGSLSFADLAEEIAATGAVEVQGSLALTDAGEEISARERVPARLATVDVRLEDIIIVNAKLTD